MTASHDACQRASSEYSGDALKHGWPVALRGLSTTSNQGRLDARLEGGVVVPPLHGLPKLCWKLGTSNLAKICGPIPWVWIFDRYQSISALLFEGQSRSSCCKRFLHAKRQRRWRRRNTARSMPWLHGQHATAESLVSWCFFHPLRRCSHATDMMMAIRMSVGPKPSSCSTCDLLQLTGHTSQYSICGGYIHVCIICKCKCIRIRICKCHIQMSIYVICIHIYIYIHTYTQYICIVPLKYI